MLSCLDADDAADVGGAGEVDHSDPWIGDQGGDDLAGIGHVVRDDIEGPGREPSFSHHVG
jgi:hypothetical protein